MKIMHNSYKNIKRNSSVKRDLFVRTQQIDSLSKEFKKIMLLPSSQRKKWVAENELFLSQIFDTLSDDSVLALDGVELDTQGMELSVEFVTKLRTIMTILKSIMKEGRRLES